MKETLDQQLNTSRQILKIKKAVSSEIKKFRKEL